MMGESAYHSYHAITGLGSGTSYVTEPNWARDLFEEQMPGFDWAKFEAWVDSDEKCCPTLWHKPPPDEKTMRDVGPVELHVSFHEDVVDKPEVITYEEKSKVPNCAKIKRAQKRTTAEQAEFKKKLMAAGLWKEYRSAANLKDGNPADNDARYKRRKEIELLAN